MNKAYMEYHLKVHRIQHHMQSNKFSPNYD